MDKYLPYIVTVCCSLISGFASYFAARRQAKAELQKLQKQHELDLEAECEKFKMEKEKMGLEHKQQMEQKAMEMGAQLGGGLFATVAQGFINSKAGQEYMQDIINKKRNQK